MTTKQSFKEVLTLFAKRPHMYVGKNRLDYLFCFLQGAFTSPLMFIPNNPSDIVSYYSWFSSYDMQKWLLLRESVSIKFNEAIDGWSLMQSCYGVGQLALEKFRIMLDEIDYSDYSKLSRDDTVVCHIYQVYALYKYGKSNGLPSPNMEVSADYYPVSDEIKNIIGKIKYDYSSIIPIVTRMIMEPHDDLLIYLHYERYFMCIKFLYRNAKGDWIEYICLSPQQDNYGDLVILHAYASLIQKEDHKSHIVTVCKSNSEINVNITETGGIENTVFNTEKKISIIDESSFVGSYNKWLADKLPTESEFTANI